MVYRILSEEEITRPLFSAFNRRQVVGDCLRRENGEWVVRPDPFIDDWSEEDYAFLIRCLRNTVRTGGFVCGAFLDGELKGFVSVEAAPFGSENQYLDLTSIHVSADCRGMAPGGNCSPGGGLGEGERGEKALHLLPLGGREPGVLPGDGLRRRGGGKRRPCGKGAF